jgi:hypothetical protein
MDALVITVLVLFALMIVAWVVLPSAATGVIDQDESLQGTAIPAASAQ